MLSPLINTRLFPKQGRDFFGLAVALTAWLLCANTCQANQIDEGLSKKGKKIFKAIEAAQYKNVGVLPWKVQIGDREPTFHYGDLNELMAKRVGNMLILMNSDKTPIGVIPDAGIQAYQSDKSKKATWRTEDDRAKLFKYTYTRPWLEAGKPNQVKVDAFVTGLVKTTKDFKSTTLVVYLFDKKDPNPREIVEINVPTETSTLVDMHVGYKVEIRGLFDKGETQISGSGSDKGQSAPPMPEKLPFADYLDLKVYYDQKEIGIVNCKLPTPQAGQKIYFRMTNKKKEPIAAVVLVNGVNTIGDEKKRDIEKYSRWVLEPKKAYAIYGFYPNVKTLHEFIARPLANVPESDFVPEEIYKIQIVVFAEYNDLPPTAMHYRTDIPGTGAAGKGPTLTLQEVQNAIRAGTKGTTANLISRGGPMDVNIETTNFMGIPAAFGVLTYGPAAGGGS